MLTTATVTAYPLRTETAGRPARPSYRGTVYHGRCGQTADWCRCCRRHGISNCPDCVALKALDAAMPKRATASRAEVADWIGVGHDL